MNSNIFNTAEYIRLSREDGDKEESDSVGNQRKLINHYIETKDEFILYDTYIDDGYTGTNFIRPAFLRMIADIEAGHINCVIVKDLSRFGRDYIETGRYLERLFPNLEVRFISIADGIDSFKQTYDMLLPIKNIFNEQYARDISRKIQMSIKAKQNAGEFIGSFCSYGYQKSPYDKNKLIVDEYAADIIRRIFSLFIKGWGKSRIAKQLNEDGILCPAEYKRINGQNYRNAHRLETTTYWSFSTINSILHKEMYIGNMVQGTKHQQMNSKQKKLAKKDWIVVENTHEPIIDRQTWDKAQSLLIKRTRKLDLNHNLSIFSGFLKCGDCGRAMVKNFWKRADGSKTYSFYCGTYKRNGKKYCTPHTLPNDVLEQIILSDLNKIISSVDNLLEFIKSQNFTSGQPKHITDTELQKIQSELDWVKQLKKSVYEDYKKDLISKDDFFSYREDYVKKEEFYTKQLTALKEKKEDPVAENILDIPFIKSLLKLKNIDNLDREIIVEMLQQITVYENHCIKISYNFSGDLKHIFSSMIDIAAKQEIV